MRVFGRGSLVLVTGGAGFIGANVCARLLKEGFRVRVLDDLSTGRRERLTELGSEGLDLEIIQGDVRSERTARDALHGAQAAVHLAVTPRPHTPLDERKAHDVTVTGTLNLLQAARAERVHRFLFASSAAVYGARTSFLLHEEAATHPVCAEGAQKLAAEGYVRLFFARDHLPAVILRFFSVYGRGQDGTSEDAPLVARLVHQLRTQAPMTIHGDGGQTRDLVHVDDVSRAVVLALQTPGAAGRTFNIAGGEGLPVRTVAAMLTELAGGAPPPRFLPLRPGEPRDVRGSVAAAAAGLSWRPQVRLRDGLRLALDGVRRAESVVTKSHVSKLPAPPRPAHGHTPPPIPTFTPARPPSPPLPSLAPPPPPSRSLPSLAPPPPSQSLPSLAPPLPSLAPPLPSLAPPSPTGPAAKPASGQSPSLFSDRPPSWAIPDERAAHEEASSIPVVLPEEPLWT